MGFTTWGETVTNTDIIDGLDKVDAKKVIIGLLERYPSLLKSKEIMDKLEPKDIRELLNKAGTKINTSLTDFQKISNKTA